MQSISFPSEVAVEHECEVLVVGGGPGGIGAAVAAGREGRDVLLVEHYGFLGGMATAGEVHPFMANHVNGESMDVGIYTDWLERMHTFDGKMEGDAGWYNNRGFDPNVARVAAEQLCQEAGVRLLFHHRPVLVETEGRNIAAAVLHSKSGLAAARGKIYVDSTGDGDLAAMAGCSFEYGGEGTPHAQPMTLCFKLKIDPADVPEEYLERGAYWWARENRDTINKVYLKARSEGRTTNHRDNVLMFPALDRFVIHFNSTRVIQKSGVNGVELSEAEIEGRKQMLELISILKEGVPFFRNAKIYSVAPQIGVRETRRITGRDYITRDDFVRCARYPDGIARCNYPIDIHNPNGEGTEITRIDKDSWYEVPFGCLLPKDIDNLIIGCRAISADKAAHASFRVMPPVCSIGQAAGTAAAMALQDSIPVCEVDGIHVKRRLIKNGRNLVAE
ncbi:FAD-dependent oxidoreductase [Planctomycetota bacterium]